MADHGYCTVDDVRRVMQEPQTEFDAGASGEDNNQLIVDAITGLTYWLEKKTKRHWYVPGGVTGDTRGLISTTPETREDEHDFATSGAWVDEQDVEEWRINNNSDALLESTPDSYYPDRETDPKENLRIAFGTYDRRYNNNPQPAYTRIEFNRKDAQAINELMVVNADGGFDDWLANKTGGIGNANRGKDWWVRVNNRGVTQLNLDVYTLDDDLASLANAVYVDFDFGTPELPMTVRRGVAHLAAADVVVDSEYLAGLPDSPRLTDVETQAERWERRGKELLSEEFDESVEGLND